MIVGIGTDIVAVSRVASVHARLGERFVHRVLVEEERIAMPAGDRGVRWLAKRWAAKEAVAKAFGTGIGGSIGFQDIVIGREAAGRPTVSLRGRGEFLAYDCGVSRVLLSISDEGDMAMAFVVLESARHHHM